MPLHLPFLRDCVALLHLRKTEGLVCRDRCSGTGKYPCSLATWEVASTYLFLPKLPGLHLGMKVAGAEVQCISALLTDLFKENQIVSVTRLCSLCVVNHRKKRVTRSVQRRINGNTAIKVRHSALQCAIYVWNSALHCDKDA